MKKLNKILLAIVLLLALPLVANAESDSSGEHNGGAGIVNSCSPNCVGMNRSSSMAGVRITFVDENGKVVAESGGKSYDFITYLRKGYTFSYYNNGFAGDRNKLAMAGGGNFTQGSNHTNSSLKFSAVAAAFDKYAQEYGSPHRSNLPTGVGENTGGNLNGMDKELAFFLSITKKGNTHYVKDVNAFIKAIAEVTNGYNADDLIYKVAEGCTNGDEIFIIMEPLFFWSGKVGGTGYTNYFGSLADSYHFFGGKPTGGIYNLNNMAYIIYYEREIPAFKGARGTSNQGFKIQSGIDLLNPVGFGLAVDWANDPAGYCGSCTYENGKFAYDNKQYPGDLVIPPKFPTVQDFAFSKQEDGGADCCEIMKPILDTLPPEWKQAYDKLCNEPDTDCCTPDVPDIPPIIDVNNCCDESTDSKVIESELDDIFCRDNNLQIDYYKNRCKNDQFKTNINEFCELYCTERVTIEVPGAITAKSGRYFKLTKTSVDTTSPYIEGYRRCRVKVFYNEWRKKYVDKVSQQVANFNEFQKKSSMYENYKEAISKKSEISDSGTVSATCNMPNSPSKTVSANYSYKYQVYPFSNNYNYYTVKLMDTNYTKVEIVADGGAKKEEHSKFSLVGYSEAKANYDGAVNSLSSQCSGGTLSGVSGGFKVFGFEFVEENPEDVIKSIASDRDKAKTSYEAAVKEAYELEENIDLCDNYFKESTINGKDYPGKDPKNNYDFTPDVLFRYSQVYLNEESKEQLDTLSVDFNKECTYKRTLNEEESGVDEIKEDRYSSIFGTGKESMHDFSKDKTIAYEKGGINLGSYYDKNYEADKKYTTDAKYEAKCKWTEKSKETYTLVPSGVASGDHSLVENFTRHDLEYKVYLSTFDGTYETYWDIDKLGHEGKLTKYFQDGKTCANEDIGDVGTTITCKLHVEHELVLTGKCNGSNGTETTIRTEDCDKYKEGYDLFLFKIVDPSDFFPTGTGSGDEAFAANWTTEARGIEVQEEIKQRANQGKTYAPENISYSFKLSSSDMKHIKNYNAEQNDKNGYSDFKLHCDPVDEVQTNSMIEGKGVTKCKSYLLEDLAKGNIKYDNKDHKVNVWNNKNTLEQVRSASTAKGRW